MGVASRPGLGSAEAPEPSGLGLAGAIPNAAAWKHQEGPLLITTNSIAGELASWAVQQSPYGCPEGLEQALTDFRAAWPTDEDMAEILPMRWWQNYDEIYRTLYALFCQTPSIEAWNHRKNGRDGPGFCSRYDQPSPDDDFIDLGALANNIAREVWKDALADKAFDDSIGASNGAPTTPASGTSAGTAETRDEAQGDSPQARPDAQTIDLKGQPND